MKLRYHEQVIDDGDIIEIKNYSYISPLRVHFQTFPATEPQLVIATWFEEVKE